MHFNPRAPCGARLRSFSYPEIIDIFQSTRPVWGATCRALSAPWPARHFNPRAPCGARPGVARHKSPARNISIHAPRVGRDPKLSEHCQSAFRFQSTRPVWGATKDFIFNIDDICISIHAPRVGRDPMTGRKPRFSYDFNPRAPCGARHHGRVHAAPIFCDFNPRAPCGARRCARV